MVSMARASREQPNWIGDTLWKQMTEYRDTEEAKEKSATTSAAQMSERNGLGPHVQFSGQKSCLQIQQEMEEELGRPVSLGEVFIKVYTKPDGTFIDQKSKNVAEAYRKNLESKLADLGIDSETSDGTSPSLGLSVEEENEIFLQSTFINKQGVCYGIGSLSETHVSGKRKCPGSSSTYKGLEEQLQKAHRKMEEQAAENSKREAEQQAKLDKLSMVERYLTETDPKFMEFLAANPTLPSDPTHAATSSDLTPKT
ncbi:uncharacterized protein LOC112087319 [Eutrema salsugineum]|uniref:uncharacterized protein LOC112087319 n=1 Tax=Eutrema salsugineum TaxID=72664 RepID=UPI000CED6280|nr:uncharacterized protein LOC112087319 [Eutrema salsugineum]